jgi:hypothetical protein
VVKAYVQGFKAASTELKVKLVGTLVIVLGCLSFFGWLGIAMKVEGDHDAKCREIRRQRDLVGNQILKGWVFIEDINVNDVFDEIHQKGIDEDCWS